MSPDAKLVETLTLAPSMVTEPVILNASSTVMAGALLGRVSVVADPETTSWAWVIRLKKHRSTEVKMVFIKMVILNSKIETMYLHTNPFYLFYFINIG